MDIEARWIPCSQRESYDPERRRDEAARTKRKMRSAKSTMLAKRLLRFKWLKVCQLLLAVYIALMVYTPRGTFGACGGLRDKETGLIIDPTSPDRTKQGLILIKGDLRPIVANGAYQLLCLGLSRMSAFFMYPALAFVFLTKLRATMSFLSSTPFSMFMFEDLHDLHTYCGWTILYGSMLHTIMHILRWTDQGRLSFLIQHRSGLSGAVIITACFLVCLPMMCWKKLKFEVRKYLHYFFYVFAIALCFHAPPSAVPNGGFAPYVFGVLLVCTVLDSLYVYIFRTENIETTSFQTLPSGVQLTMQVERFQRSGPQQGGYCYVCFPWIDRQQWHAFSLFENPSNPCQRQIFIAASGDWTKAVLASCMLRNTNRPIWVQGPFPSPYNSSIKYDNQILVASGIGITPALSVIHRARQEKVRRANLIWSVRDPNMLEFFLAHAYLESNSGWNIIYYTGKEPLVGETIKNLTKGSNVCVLKGRARFESLIPAIIYGIETEKGLPERYGPSKQEQAVRELAQELTILDKDTVFSSQEKVVHLENRANELGYQFTDPMLEDVIMDERLLKAEGTRDPTKVSSSSSSGSSSMIRIRTSIALQTRTYGIESVLEKLRTVAASAPTDEISEAALDLLDMIYSPCEKQEEEQSLVCSDFVKEMAEAEKITWGILYCGSSSSKLQSKLELVAYELDLNFHAECFAW